ncbi:DUF6600 domain-containing protein [Dechloromonas denitrificans]|uniref:DUF6600 domain-containing protein n=1 Tax=Dechloromonas denitrificans TaxID=281362 RepID=UPI001CF800CF|nr:DUF6600 domain-containing protein [Dechloromonas denitrificans]UCV03609.1 hypothetical protein KI611_21560 [Dechloromonas denitrificans]
MNNLLRLAGAALSLVLALSSGAALADPPARVGRLAYLENGVDLAVNRDEQGAPATLNWPISSGAILDTDRRGRAEVWVASSAFRLAGNSRVEFVLVDDRQVTLDVTEGSLAVSILDRDQVNDVTVHTPDGSIRFVTPGRYRIDVLDDRSELSVQAGQANIDYRGRLTPVAAGQRASLAGAGQVRLEADLDPDAFDNWVAERENATMARVARRHVAPQMTGYQDLDAYGDWQPAAEYGSVWYPRSVAADWAPYRFGRWAWVAPWGWTWIDQSPWGFAPFHYGRWVIIGGRWGWVPGSHVARPVYAPALVGWIGNPGWNVSFSFGSAPAVGWFPLAPREVYVPAYLYSPTYIRQININHVREVSRIERAERSGAHETFVHRALPRAVTVVPANLMREGRSIGANEIRRPERNDLSRAPQAKAAPSAEWLKPAPAAVRPRPDERRESPNWRGERRDAERQVAPINNERPMRRENAPVPARPPETPNPAPAVRAPLPQVAPPSASEQAREPRREMRDAPRMERGVPRENASPAVRPPEMPSAPPAVRAPLPQVAPPPASEQPREPRREMRDAPRMERGVPRENVPPVVRLPEMPSAPPAVRAPLPQVAPPSVSEQPREMRREMRDAPRMERVAPRESAPAMVRPPEMPAPAPVVRMPPPAPVAPQAAPVPPPQEQRGNREREKPRRGERDDERGPR